MLLTNRTDMLKDDYKGTPWPSHITEFNKVHPNIKVDIEGITDYANDTLLRLQGGAWGDIMMIPAVAEADCSTYFLSYGSVADVSKEVNYINIMFLTVRKWFQRTGKRSLSFMFRFWPK